MLNKKVLVKSITSLSEARYCAGMFVDYISFDLCEESEYHVSKKKFDEIRGWLSGVQILVSFPGNDLALIQDALKHYEPDGFLFAPGQFHLLPLIDTPVKVLEWADDPAELPFNPEPDVVLLLTGPFQITSLKNITNEILQGFDFENIKDIPEQINGLAFMGSIEQQVGANSYPALMEALEYIEENY